MLGKAFVAVVAALSVGAADTDPSLIPHTADAKADYRSTFAGTLWNGQQVSYRGTFTLVRTDEQTIHIAAEGADAELNAAARLDGRKLSVDSHSDAIAAAVGFVNQFEAPIASHAGFHPGDSWTARIPVYVGDTSPVEGDAKVTVISSDGDRTMLQATAAIHGVSSYAGYSNPVDVTLRLAEQVGAGRFERGDAAVTEVVHAANQDQTLRWTMSLASQ
jgi:hypothetical protein